MSNVIRIPSKIYTRLEKHARGFDTPINVIEKLLDHYEGVTEPSPHEQPRVTPLSGRDTTKYIFNGKQFGKGKLVLAIVHQYVIDEPDTSFADLLVAFPKHLQGSNGVISNLETAEDIVQRTAHKRHFLKSKELVQLTDCTVAVSTEWGAGNIDNFIRQAESLGYVITLNEI